MSKENVMITEKEKTQSLYTINEVAKLLNVHQQTLRNWERKKLVIPLRAGMRRVYNREHIELCKKIKEFSGKGVSLKGIGHILKSRFLRQKFEILKNRADVSAIKRQMLALDGFEITFVEIKRSRGRVFFSIDQFKQC